MRDAESEPLALLLKGGSIGAGEKGYNYHNMLFFDNSPVPHVMKMGSRSDFVLKLIFHKGGPGVTTPLAPP